MCCGCDTSYIVSVHIQFQASIYTLSLCRGQSWRVRLAKQETLTHPGHLVSPLVCRDSWMSTVVLYCWCHSDSVSVLLYFTFGIEPKANDSYFITKITACRCSHLVQRNNLSKEMCLCQLFLSHPRLISVREIWTTNENISRAKAICLLGPFRAEKHLWRITSAAIAVVMVTGITGCM